MQPFYKTLAVAPGFVLALLLAFMLFAAASAQTPLTGVVTRNANLRAGPGVTYAVAGSLPAGATVQIVEKNAGGDWCKLEDGKWIAAFLVRLDEAPAAPAATAAVTATVSGTRTAAAPAATVVPSTPATTARQNANLREGPGASYAVVGGLRAGEAVEAAGRNAAGDWIQLADGTWVAASLLAGAPANLPVTAVSAQLPGGNPTAVPSAPAPAAPAASTPAPSAPAAPAGWQTEQNGIIFTSDCPCNQGDVLNCKDFGIEMDAQACYLRCQEVAGRDVHGLDRDKDGSACERSWWASGGKAAKRRKGEINQGVAIS